VRFGSFFGRGMMVVIVPLDDEVDDAEREAMLEDGDGGGGGRRRRDMPAALVSTEREGLFCFGWDEFEAFPR
jgi:hypothetical protein